jgi:uncharacterized RDD family membrane protein YckC
MEGGFPVGLALHGTSGAVADERDITAVIATIVIWLLVTTGASAVLKGQSVGKRLGGIRVLTRSGHPAGFGTSLLRDQVLRFLYLVPLFTCRTSPPRRWTAA